MVSSRAWPLLLLAAIGAASAGKGGNRMTLYAAGFFPVSTKIPEGAIGRGVIPAVELALQHINDSPKVLRGIHLDLVWNDTEVLYAQFIFSTAAAKLRASDCYSPNRHFAMVRMVRIYWRPFGHIAELARERFRSLKLHSCREVTRLSSE